MALLILVMLPFWSNYLIRTYAWIVLLNNEGLINCGLQELGIINAPLPLLYNEFAIVVGPASTAICPSWSWRSTARSRASSRRSREASADLGASSLAHLRRVTLPLTVPGIAAGSVFVFVLSRSATS